MYTRWWIQIFFIFTSIWGRFPFWLIFFKRVKPPTSMVYLPTYLPLAKNVQTIHVGQFLPVPWMIWISNRSIEVPALHPSPPNVGSTPLEFCALISWKTDGNGSVDEGYVQPAEVTLIGGFPQRVWPVWQDLGILPPKWPNFIQVRILW